MNQPDLFNTTAAQKESFFADLNKSEGLHCPCCDRYAHIWPYRVHSTLAYMLVRLYRRSIELHGNPFGYVHIEAFKPQNRTGNDFSIVKHWGIAIPKLASIDEDKNSSGMWALTKEGADWVRGASSISKHANVFDDKVILFSPEVVNIQQALGKKFSYSELMEGA